MFSNSVLLTLLNGKSLFAMLLVQLVLEIQEWKMITYKSQSVLLVVVYLLHVYVQSFVLHTSNTGKLFDFQEENLINCLKFGKY